MIAYKTLSIPIEYIMDKRHLQINVYCAIQIKRISH